jgi:sugar/nucleoside kinase (ribokinase family)
MPQVVVVGAASRDVDRADPRGWHLGGGATYGTLTLARLGVRVAVVLGVDELAAAATEVDWLRAAGASIHLVRLDEGPVFELLAAEEAPGADPPPAQLGAAPPGRRRIRCLAPGHPVEVGTLPDGWAAAEAWLFAPVAGEIPDAWADVPATDALVGLGWQGLLRTLGRGSFAERRPPSASPLVRRADIVGVSVEDLAADVRIESIDALLGSAATLLLTGGPLGGVRRLMPGQPGSSPRAAARAWPALPADRLVDATGAGDVFLAAYIAARLATGGRRAGIDDSAALRVAAAAASLTVEEVGLAGVPTAIAVAARARRAASG